MVFHKSYRDAVLKVVDGAGSPVTTTIDVAEGDLSIKVARNVNEILNRGVLHEVKLGDDVPMDVSFTVKLESLVAGTKTIWELLTKTGSEAATAGTRDTTTNVHTVDLKWELLTKAGAVEETILLPDFYYTSIDVSEGMPYSTIAVTGKSFATLPTVS